MLYIFADLFKFCDEKISHRCATRTGANKIYANPHLSCCYGKPSRKCNNYKWAMIEILWTTLYQTIDEFIVVTIDRVTLHAFYHWLFFPPCYMWYFYPLFTRFALFLNVWACACSTRTIWESTSFAPWVLLNVALPNPELYSAVISTFWDPNGPVTRMKRQRIPVVTIPNITGEFSKSVSSSFRLPSWISWILEDNL